MSFTSSIDSSPLLSSSWKNKNLFFIEDKIPPPDALDIVESNLTSFESISSSISSESSSWISCEIFSSVY